MGDNDSSTKKKILVVEDDEQIMDTLKEMLGMAGYEVAAAIDGFKGLKLFKEFRPDILISDIVMPDKDGIEMVREIRKIDYSIKVIFITAWYQRDDISSRLNEELRKHPDYRLLKKPFKMDQLWKMVENYLDE